jgi:hypothetical protein
MLANGQRFTQRNIYIKKRATHFMVGGSVSGAVPVALYGW